MDNSLRLLSPVQALYTSRVRWVPDHDNDRFIPTDILTCDHPIYNPHHYELASDRFGSPFSRLPDEDYTDEDQLRSRRRAKRAVRDYMDCNQFQYFMTFTLDGSRIQRDDYAAFVKAVGKYLDNRVMRYGWKYVAVPEYHHDKKSLHLHAVVVGDKYNLVDSGTVLIPDRKKPVRISTADKYKVPIDQRKTVYNVTDWKWGFSTAIKVYGGRKALTNYILKYITKSDSKIGGRWYYSGGKLIKPLYTYANIDWDDMPFTGEFHNDGGSFRLYDLSDGVDIQNQGLQTILERS